MMNVPFPETVAVKPGIPRKTAEYRRERSQVNYGMSRFTRLDFASPLQGRKWLRLLEENPRSGIRITPNLELRRSVLGFSFDSNRYGLRGPCNENAQAILFGTSFAMGFAVDMGCDWFSELLAPTSWFNAGLPVGPAEWSNLVQDHCHGPRELALLLYHPNLWYLAAAYAECRRKLQGAFRFFRWKTDLWSCLRLQMHKTIERRRLLAQGKRVLVEHEGGVWCLDSTYSVRPGICDEVGVQESAQNLVSLLKSFKRVVCLRIPIKEQLIPAQKTNEHFRAANNSYESTWQFTKTTLSAIPAVSFFEFQDFHLSHFHGFDTHLNESGNHHLRELVRGVLRKHHLNELLIA